MGYYKAKQIIMSRDRFSVLNSHEMLNINLDKQVKNKKVTQEYNSRILFSNSLFTLVFKPNHKWKRIHQFFYLIGHLINRLIQRNLGSLIYTTCNKAKYQVIKIGPGSIIIKWDLKDGFCNIFVVSKNID